MLKIKTEDLNYKLNKSNIAQNPYRASNNSKLLISDTKEIIKFKNINKILDKKSVFVFNKSSVIDVRILTEKLDTKGKIEIFILNKKNETTAVCLIKMNSKKIIKKTYKTINFNFKIIEIIDNTYIVQFNKSVNQIIKNYGITPLPPYIEDKKYKYKYYKTDFSRGGFSTASPTAGLHFSNNLIKKISKNNNIIKYLNLDVGIGTFKPIDTEYIDDFDIHSEFYNIKKNDFKEIINLKNEGYEIYSVGTTVLRTLETVYLNKKYNGKTNLYITPGFKFNVCDYLITNFHAPKSTLLLIVLTIYGNKWKELYKYAQDNNMKFLSFGDAVLFKI